MEQALYQAAILTFEELGFMFPLENADQTAIDAAGSVRVEVGFAGTISGRIVLEVEDEILPVIASNMLGLEEPLERELQYDVLGELANVICGNALPAIAGRQEIFKLQPPALLGGAKTADRPSAEAHLELDEGRACVTLYLN
jgi:CheY-specific phosphatase CheX